MYEPNALMDTLKYVRQWTDQYKPPWIIWALCTSGLLATLVIKMLFPNTARSTNSSTARYMRTYVCECCESIVCMTLCHSNSMTLYVLNLIILYLSSHLMLRVRVWLTLRTAVAMFHEYVYTKYCYIN